MPPVLPNLNPRGSLLCQCYRDVCAFALSSLMAAANTSSSCCCIDSITVCLVNSGCALAAVSLAAHSLSTSLQNSQHMKMGP